MTACLNRLEETRRALHDALSRQDWAAIGLLDRECRQVVDEALRQPVRDESLVRQCLQELLELYQELVSRCQAERQRIAADLRQLNQSRQGAQVYQLFG